MKITIEVARPRLPRRIAVPLAAIVLAIPAAVLAGHQFSDVPSTHTFHDDIDAIADAGITSGCGVGKYCPAAFVTRGQMAAFMNKLGALAPDKTPVVNAAQLDGLDSAAFMPRATYIVNREFEVPATSQGGPTAPCDEGDALLSGGHFGVNPTSQLEESQPQFDGEIELWGIFINNPSAVPDSVQALALCADVAPLHVEVDE